MGRHHQQQQQYIRTPPPPSSSSRKLKQNLIPVGMYALQSPYTRAVGRLRLRHVRSHITSGGRGDVLRALLLGHVHRCCRQQRVRLHVHPQPQAHRLLNNRIRKGGKHGGWVESRCSVGGRYPVRTRFFQILKTWEVM